MFVCAYSVSLTYNQRNKGRFFNGFVAVFGCKNRIARNVELVYFVIAYKHIAYVPARKILSVRNVGCYGNKFIILVFAYNFAVHRYGVKLIGINLIFGGYGSGSGNSNLTVGNGRLIAFFIKPAYKFISGMASYFGNVYCAVCICSARTENVVSEIFKYNIRGAYRSLVEDRLDRHVIIQIEAVSRVFAEYTSLAVYPVKEFVISVGCSRYSEIGSVFVLTVFKAFIPCVVESAIGFISYFAAGTYCNREFLCIRNGGFKCNAVSTVAVILGNKAVGTAVGKNGAVESTARNGNNIALAKFAFGFVLPGISLKSFAFARFKGAAGNCNITETFISGTVYNGNRRAILNCTAVFGFFYRVTGYIDYAAARLYLCLRNGAATGFDRA